MRMRKWLRFVCFSLLRHDPCPDIFAKILSHPSCSKITDCIVVRRRYPADSAIALCAPRQDTDYSLATTYHRRPGVYNT
jgi:hypothetical protein